MHKSNTEILPQIIEGIQEKKGKSITILDLHKIESAPARNFIICEGNTPIQIGALADSISDIVLEKHHRKPSHTDGYRSKEWLILDYGEAVVHIFLPEARKRYSLEQLWSDAEITEIPDLD
jgi:ribosome-associated protein